MNDNNLNNLISALQKLNIKLEKNKLEQNPKLQNALQLIILKSAELIANIDRNQGHIPDISGESKASKAVKTYLKEIIELAFQGKKAFMKGHEASEKKLAKVINDDEAKDFSRFVKNIIITALATFSVVGLIAMAATSKARGGFLLFRDPVKDHIHHNISSHLAKALN